MDYNLKIGEIHLPVTADLRDDGILSASIGNETYLARCQRISDNQIHLQLGSGSLNVYVADMTDGKLINIEGMSYLVQDADTLAQNYTRKRGNKEGPLVVTPPMPSVVVRILVTAGDQVEKGQGVMIVTAMKMEATLCAPYKGTVLKINVSEGNKVMPGQILIDIEKEETDTPTDGDRALA
ncbi:MAG: hypothetical protein CVU71_01525 [Deltaproteobacteria bacterium HGW-Deltaproteobacteria-6]|jgi:biotin carboxyl carrier protein|nr:MAG: hypothetical protein CVU71_01525 [Deltaproteobacteria bacterium HGW-Deltaproteobacteria-6]